MTKTFAQLDRRDVGMMLIYRDSRRSHRVKLVGLERKTTHTVAWVTSGFAGEQPLTLAPDTPISLEP